LDEKQKEVKQHVNQKPKLKREMMTSAVKCNTEDAWEQSLNKSVVLFSKSKGSEQTKDGNAFFLASQPSQGGKQSMFVPESLVPHSLPPCSSTVGHFCAVGLIVVCQFWCGSMQA